MCSYNGLQLEINWMNSLMHLLKYLCETRVLLVPLMFYTFYTFINMLFQISFVDYTVFDLLDNHLILAPGCLDQFPKLKAFHGRMAAREKIASYRQTDAFKKMMVNGNGKQ